MGFSPLWRPCFPLPKGLISWPRPPTGNSSQDFKHCVRIWYFPQGHQRSHYEQSQNMVRSSALISRLSRVSLYLGHGWRCAALPQDLGPLRRSICLVSWRWLCPRPSGHPEPPGVGRCLKPGEASSICSRVASGTGSFMCTKIGKQGGSTSLRIAFSAALVFPCPCFLHT